MLPDLEQLLVLHDRDSRRLSLEKRLVELPQDITRAKLHLTNDLKSVSDCKDAINQNSVAAKKLELDIETRKNTIERLKTQQFETKKNDEFRALEGEVKRYEEQVDDLETEQLEFMESEDVLRNKLTSAEEALKKTQALVDEELASFSQLETNCKSEIAELLAERGSLAEALPAPTLKLYDKLLISKKGQALAEVKGGQCAGCHMKLVPSTLSTLRSHKVLAQCENCTRILFEQ